MNDAIGAAGMVRGWAILFHMYFVWLPTLVLISVAVVTLTELLVSMFGLHLPLLEPHRRPGEPSRRAWGSDRAINNPGSAQPIAVTPQPELPAGIQ
jgi:hypothetical protein